MKKCVSQSPGIALQHRLFISRSTQTLTFLFLACDVVFDILFFGCLSHTTFVGGSDT